jgi:hypothetical protein
MEQSNVRARKPFNFKKFFFQWEWMLVLIFYLEFVYDK